MLGFSNEVAFFSCFGMVLGGGTFEAESSFGTSPVIDGGCGPAERRRRSVTVSKVGVSDCGSKSAGGGGTMREEVSSTTVPGFPGMEQSSTMCGGGGTMHAKYGARDGFESIGIGPADDCCPPSTSAPDPMVLALMADFPPLGVVPNAVDCCW